MIFYRVLQMAKAYNTSLSQHEKDRIRLICKIEREVRINNLNYAPVPSVSPLARLTKIEKLIARKEWKT